VRHLSFQRKVLHGPSISMEILRILMGVKMWPQLPVPSWPSSTEQTTRAVRAAVMTIMIAIPFLMQIVQRRGAPVPETMTLTTNVLLISGIMQTPLLPERKARQIGPQK